MTSASRTPLRCTTFRGLEGEVLAEYDQADSLTAEYVYANAQRIAKLTPAGAADIYLSDHPDSLRSRDKF